MSFKDNNKYYGRISRFNHWLSALVVIGMLAVGLYFHDLPKGDEKSYWVELHIAVGGLFFLFLLFRVFWRILTKSPKPPVQQKSLEIATKLVHWLMLFSIFIMAISGPIVVWTKGIDINVFNWFAIPGPFGEMPDLHELSEEIHEIAANTLLVTIIIHILASLKHQFLHKDQTMARMVKFLRK